MATDGRASLRRGIVDQIVRSDNGWGDVTIRKLVMVMIFTISSLTPSVVAAQEACEFEVTRYITYETWSGEEVTTGLRADGVFRHVTSAGEYDADVMRYLDADGRQVEVRYSGGLFHHLRRSGGGPEASRFLTFARIRLEGESKRRVMRARYLSDRRGSGSGVFCVEEVTRETLTRSPH